jgi:uncharacterized protein YbcI
MPDGELSAALSNAIVALMAEYTGRGATQSKTFVNAMRPELIAIVERLTGRNVAAFMSADHVDPDVAVETFVLELSRIAADRKDDTGGPAHT